MKGVLALLWLICAVSPIEACEVGFFGVKCQGECGRCKNDACSSVDGHCSDGCQLWFIGNLCKEELRKPSLDGSSPSVSQVNESAVVIIWTQDSTIPENHAQYFGYTVAYAEGSGDFKDGPRVAHDASTMQQRLIVSNIYAYREYLFHVRVYRDMDGERQYGYSSNSIRIQLSSSKPPPPTSTSVITSSVAPTKDKLIECEIFLGHSNDVIAKWKTIATVVGAVSGVLILVLIAIILLQFFRFRRALSKASKQTPESVLKNDGNTVGQPTPMTVFGPSYENVNQGSTERNDESSPMQYESLDGDPPRNRKDPYTNIEGVYQEIHDRDLS